MTAAAALPAPNAKATLYTPELLALAVSLADHPLAPAHRQQGEARSRICGSVVVVSMDLDDNGCVTRFGTRVSACAVGQAAVASFARGVVGHNAASLADVRAEISLWLRGQGPLPSWPALGTLSAALPHTSRHSAILLPWDAALRALSNSPEAD